MDCMLYFFFLFFFLIDIYYISITFKLGGI
jgi:hypothetical protein